MPTSQLTGALCQLPELGAFRPLPLPPASLTRLTNLVAMQKKTEKRSKARQDSKARQGSKAHHIETTSMIDRF